MNSNLNSDLSSGLNTDEELYSALKDGKKNVIDEYLKRGFNIENHIKGGWTLLMHACSLGNPEIVEYLLHLGADCKVTDHRFTPLMAVCQLKLNASNKDDLLKCIDLLLKHGVDVNASDKFGQTALMYAAEGGRTEIVDKLIAQKCYINVQDCKGKSALFAAVLKGHENIVKILIANGARLDLVDCDCNTAYDIAVLKKFSEIAKLVCTQKGMDIAADETKYFKCNQEPIDSIINALPSMNGNTDTSGFPSDVEILLSGMELSMYRDSFSKNNIQLGEFLIITEQRLKEIGVKFSVHRQHILYCIQKFHAKEWCDQSLGFKPQKSTVTLEDGLLLLANTIKHLHILKATMESIRHEVMTPIDATIFKYVEMCSNELKKSDLEIRKINRFAVNLEKKDKVESADLIKPMVTESKLKKVVGIIVFTAFLVGGTILKNQRHLNLFRIRF